MISGLPPLVREGDQVAAGQVLMRFDDTTAQAQYAVLQNQYDVSVAHLKAQALFDEMGKICKTAGIPWVMLSAGVTSKQFVRVATGATAQIRLIAYQQPAAVVVPNKSLAFGAAGWTVEVKLADGKTEHRPVRRGRVSTNETEIISGLEVGQVIVVPGS